jgi:hypothetical protein
MERRSLLRTIIVSLVLIGIVVVFIMLLAKIFTRHSGPTTPGINLGDYSSGDSSVTLLIDAPTNIDQEHYQLRITVGPIQNTIERIQGYQNDVVDSRSYANNESAYATFLQSLKLLNFTKGTKSTADYRGYCPTGERYVYTFNNGTKDLLNYWSTSCGQGTYGGNRSLTRQIIERQVPSADLDALSHNIPV